MSKALKISARIARSTAVDRVLKLGDILNSLIPDPTTAAVATGIHATIAELREWIRNRDDRRIREFHEALLSKDELSGDASDKSGSIETADFHALLSACLSDIEDEKTSAYANLTKAILFNKVPKELRRHFIISLKDLSWEYLDYLRRIYVVSKHNVMPEEGVGRVAAQDLLTNYEAGSIEQLAVANLTAKSFIDGVQLSHLGEAFIEACSADDDLEPYSFEYKTWLGLTCNVMFLGSDLDCGTALLDQLAARLRIQRIKVGAFALKGVLRSSPWQRLDGSHYIVITRGNSLAVDEVESLRSFLGKRGLLHVNIGSKGHSTALLENFMQIDDPIKTSQWDEVVTRFVNIATLNP